ncbi:MAG TPA: hypothetical protein ENJ31_01490 [Anaerolineae bacterium]|nr:hypothetical protein [Anaerolineae bacterium]
MPTFRVELPNRPSRADLEALQTALAPYGYVDQLPPAKYDFQSVSLIISFASDMLQGADVLVHWLRRVPRGNQAVIRLADGRSLKMESSHDPDAFLKALKSALKEL